MSRLSTRLRSSYTSLAADERTDGMFVLLLLIAELLLGLAIIHRVPYTEIDWNAYMQEVQAWLDGETDYRKIRGDTGPLVYPAGFVYLFAFLKYITGGNVRQAQYVFLGCYIATQATVLLLYQQQVTRQRSKQRKNDLQMAHVVWSWRLAMTLLCLSKRIHSIFLLRLFNDGPTMMVLYISVLMFTSHYWDLGCVIFSIAVSIKMNVLLFAPGLLLLLLQASWNLQQVLVRLLLGCALPQLILGAPFLTTFPISYLRKAFELDRVFFYKWTVNWKFLPEDIFLSKQLSLILACCHLACLAIAAVAWLVQAKRETGQRVFLKKRLSAQYICYTMLVSNMIGIVFCRTLHYQFYCWYFHAVPYLLWWNDTDGRPDDSFPRILINVGLWAALEWAFNVFPATPTSSAVLQAVHLAILFTVRPPRRILEPDDDNTQSTTSRSKKKME